ncbi:MAG: molybdopterin-dependent oxidoreductase [Chloroflexi bacterium]|nr:molybdopterin-dependent oxidoreductase [Chloroflexota bacterium]MCI0829122.1 molybdopterin-dependent oxidoreductase [Chloroflexota bacterium]MCI0847841.1 molybdopterin-dependent oxidoreductase [Chloroflexota bacterium]MCI0863177.1 molybdopterin-dependent oxidoreductase [Chloroflexota bacterium]MCI0897897.1 molybdopterin-dependent oxidoreductase [Chloroflexota bacterium]
MKLTRRNFLAWAGLGAVGAVACEGFGIRRGELDIQSPVRLPEDLVRGSDNWYASLCRTCPSCEGIVVRVMEGRAKKIQGNPLYPTNQGKTHARCEAGLQALYHPDRIATPMRRSGPRGSDEFVPIKWQPDGIDSLRNALRANGSSSVMITEPLRGHLGLLVERFASAIGGEHLGFEAIDNNTLRAAVKNVFQQDTLPDFDLDNSRFILSFGADFLSTWVSPTRYNRGYGEFRQGEGRDRGMFYQIDSRFSMTAANADKWLPVRPGWEGHLALSLAQVIVSENLQARGVDVDTLVGGDSGIQALNNFRPETVAPLAGLTPEMTGGDPVEFLKNLARSFASNRPSIAIGGGSAGAQSNGLFNLEAIYALNFLVGSVGGKGGVRFNPGSPWDDVPASSKVGSLEDWTRVAEQIRSGKTKLLLLHGADPVHGLPDSVRLRDAIAQANDLFVVSFSPFIDDTSVMADLILPDRVSLEDWGDDIAEPGPGYQVVGMQQPVVNPLGDLDPLSFPDVLLTMAQELGKESQLPWANFKAMLREGSDALFAMNRGSIEASSADEFWNNLLRRGGWWDERRTGPAGVNAPDGLFRTIAGKATGPDFAGIGMGSDSFYLAPFAHNTLLDGYNGHLPWLQAAPDPLSTVTWQTWVELNDVTAKRMGVKEGDILRIESSKDSIRAVAYPTPAAPLDVISVPFGQGRKHGSDYATDRPGRESSNVMDILETTLVKGTGSLAWAGTRVRVSKTGESVSISKLEGNARAVEIGLTPAEKIIKTIAPENA